MIRYSLTWGQAIAAAGALEAAIHEVDDLEAANTLARLADQWHEEALTLSGLGAVDRDPSVSGLSRVKARRQLVRGSKTRGAVLGQRRDWLILDEAQALDGTGRWQRWLT